MSESKEIALVNLPAAPADLEAAFIDDEYINNLIKEIREKASSVVGDVNTAKGRGVYISMSANVRKAKTAIDDAGKALVADMKKRPALVDASRRKVREALDQLAIDIRKPATEWEAEQERIAAEKSAEEERLRIESEAKKAAEELAKEIEMAHREALIDNYEFDRALEEAKAEAERRRIAHEQQIAREAEERAQREAEEKIRLEREASERRERDLKEAKEKAERDAIEAKDRAERDRIAAEQKAIADRKAAEEKAERDKQEAIAETQRKAKEEADRIKRETEAKEAARLAEEKRIADEKARREADTENRKTINNQVIEILTKAGISPECAKDCVIAIVKNQNQSLSSGITPPVQINY